MLKIPLIAATLLFATLVGAQDVAAFSMDRDSLNTRDGSPRFADPEDEVEARFGGEGNGASQPDGIFIAPGADGADTSAPCGIRADCPLRRYR
ncbi:MAG: hypothetical protein JO089_05875 [Alphaproteobacteria bacterium]|nr:hypothetical protein [Alphaproteobacteria bacterium]